MRDRQRAYYYDKLDKLFHRLQREYERRFGNQYSCAANNAEQLYKLFYRLCDRYGIAPRMTPYEPQTETQQS